MGFGRDDYETRCRKRKEKYQKRAVTTAHNKKIAVDRTKTMMNELVRMIKESGLTQTKISQMSGVCTAAIPSLARFLPLGNQGNVNSIDSKNRDKRNTR